MIATWKETAEIYVRLRTGVVGIDMLYHFCAFYFPHIISTRYITIVQDPVDVPSAVIYHSVSRSTLNIPVEIDSVVVVDNLLCEEDSLTGCSWLD